jgi:hypothetical protein
MKIKPYKWTHHHTMRLYHISRLLTFSASSLVVMFGMLLAIVNVRASDIILDNNADVSATVPAISLGPTVFENTDGSGGYAGTYPTSPVKDSDSVIKPEVFIDIPYNVPRRTEIKNGKQSIVFKFDSQFLEVKGYTNIPEAIVFIEVSTPIGIRSATFADAEGKWNYKFSGPILPGSYVLTATAQSQSIEQMTATTSLNFEIVLPEGVNPVAPTLLKPGIKPVRAGNLFDVLVRVPEQFKVIAPGNDLVVNVKLINFGSVGYPVDVTVQYTLEDDTGKIVLQRSETVAVATQLSMIKTFRTTPDLSQGTYKIIIKVPSENIIAESSDTFQLKGDPVLVLGKDAVVDFTLLFQGLIALFFLFALIVYFEYNKVVALSHIIKKVDQTDLSLIS